MALITWSLKSVSAWKRTPQATLRPTMSAGQPRVNAACDVWAGLRKLLETNMNDVFRVLQEPLSVNDPFHLPHRMLQSDVEARSPAAEAVFETFDMLIAHSHFIHAAERCAWGTVQRPFDVVMLTQDEIRIAEFGCCATFFHDATARLSEVGIVEFSSFAAPLLGSAQLRRLRIVECVGLRCIHSFLQECITSTQRSALPAAIQYIHVVLGCATWEGPKRRRHVVYEPQDTAHVFRQRGAAWLACLAPAMISNLTTAPPPVQQYFFSLFSESVMKHFVSGSLTHEAKQKNGALIALCYRHRKISYTFLYFLLAPLFRDERRTYRTLQSRFHSHSQIPSQFPRDKKCVCLPFAFQIIAICFVLTYFNVFFLNNDTTLWKKKSPSSLYRYVARPLRPAPTTVIEAICRGASGRKQTQYSVIIMTHKVQAINFKRLFFFCDPKTAII